MDHAVNATGILALNPSVRPSLFYAVCSARLPRATTLDFRHMIKYHNIYWKTAISFPSPNCNYQHCMGVNPGDRSVWKGKRNSRFFSRKEQRAIKPGWQQNGVRHRHVILYGYITLVHIRLTGRPALLAQRINYADVGAPADTGAPLSLNDQLVDIQSIVIRSSRQRLEITPRHSRQQFCRCVCK